MYTSKERVVRDGHLVAFEGEVMTDDEASKRGLADSAEPEGPESLEDLTVPQLKEVAKREGVEIPAKAKKGDIIKAINGEEPDDAPEDDLYDDDEEAE